MSGDLNESWVKMRAVPQQEGIRTHVWNFTRARDTPRHVHHEYVFSLILRGAAEFDCGHCGATHTLQPNDVLLTEAREVYACRALGLPPWRSLALSIEREKLESLLEYAVEKPIALPHYTTGAIKNAQMRRLFLRLHESLSEDRAALEQETLLLDWLAALGENYSEQPHLVQNRRVYSESAAVQKAREYIAENLGENIRLQTLAEIARLSPFHLNRVFSAQVGLPPHEFQNQLRLEKALKLIARRKPLAEIAFKIGFSDQSHFNRFFKRYLGITPKKILVP